MSPRRKEKKKKEKRKEKKSKEKKRKEKKKTRKRKKKKRKEKKSSKKEKKDRERRPGRSPRVLPPQLQHHVLLRRISTFQAINEKKDLFQVNKRKEGERENLKDRNSVGTGANFANDNPSLMIQANTAGI